MAPIVPILLVAAGAWLMYRRHRLGRYFSLGEFTVTSTGLVNVPAPQAIANLRALVSNVLDPLREDIGAPIRITSGYRSPEVNAAIGGSDTSDHMYGRSADFKADGWTASQLADRIEALGLPFDQLITYSAARGGHLHVSYRASGNRGQRWHEG